MSRESWTKIDPKGEDPGIRSGMGYDVTGNWLVIFGGLSSYLFE